MKDVIKLSACFYLELKLQMLFQSDYWVAASYSSKKETIQQFLETVIIEMEMPTNHIQNILDKYNYGIKYYDI